MCSYKSDKKIVSVFAPGKMMLAGEWAVLEPGNLCIVLATAEGIRATLETYRASDSIIIDAPDVGLHMTKSDELGEKFCFVKSAIEIVKKYFYKKFGFVPKNLLIKISSKLSPGRGSSAAVVVAIVRGVLKFYDIKFCSETIFKLAGIAHFLAQGKTGSGFDVAASTYGGALLYKRFEPSWLADQLEKNSVKEIVEKKWPSLKIQEIDFPKKLFLLVSCTYHKASTKDLIKNMAVAREKNREAYLDICKKIDCVVGELAEALARENGEEILALIKQNRNLLLELSVLAGVELETGELKKICDLAEEFGAAAKFSGAGGGDCAIALCLDRGVASRLQRNKYSILNLATRCERYT